MRTAGILARTRGIEAGLILRELKPRSRGLLINFGAELIKDGISRVVNGLEEL